MTVRHRRLAILLVGLALIVSLPAQHAQREFPTDVACNEPALPDTFLSRTGTVVLRVSVTDGDHSPIRCLTRDDFQVREEGRLQTISAFSDEDLPITVGLVVDTGSRMAGWHPDVAAAGLAFARASRTDDEFFAIAFSDTVDDLMSADSPFTHEAAVLGDALLQMRAGGPRALYDGVAHGLDFAARGRLDQRALIVISSGRDTASRLTLPQLADRIAGSPTVVYAIVIVDPDDATVEVPALRQLTALSGGEVFVANDPRALPSMLEMVARDIRTRYTMAYEPPDTADGARFRAVNVTLTKAKRAATLRHREGYVGGSR